MKTWCARWLGVLLAVIGAATVAGAVPPVFTVDYKLLFLLHPKMAEFDLTLGRHLKPGVKVYDQATRDALAKEMETLNVEAKKAVEAQQQVIVKLSQEQVEGGLRVAPTASQTAPMLLWEAEQARKAELQKRIDEARRVQEEALDRVFDPMYLPRSESRAVIEAVLSEIDAELERVSEAKGGALILDADFVRAAPVPTRYHATINPSLDLVDIGLRQSLLEYNFATEKMPELYTKRPELQLKFAEAMHRLKGFESGIATTLSRYPGVAAALGARGRLILAGGKQHDLTREILGEMYKKNRVREDVASRILDLVTPPTDSSTSTASGAPGLGEKKSN